MYLVGWDKQEIKIEPKGFAMFGYGMWSHRAYEKRTNLFARSITIQTDHALPLMICCLDLGCITYAMRSGAIQLLQQDLAEQFQADRLVLMATHTHSGPGGCAHEALYNIPTPGFVPEHLAAVIEAIVSSVKNALQSAQTTEIRTTSAKFEDSMPVAWNRSLQAYNRNPEVVKRTEAETHIALNREMQLLGFYRDGKLNAFVSFFGVHATCLGNTLKAHDGDNKGYAAQHSENYLIEQGVMNPVTIFAQATAGDVSPHFHGDNQLKIRKMIKGEAEYQYAKRNGVFQSDLAIKALVNSGDSSQKNMEPKVGAILSYVNLSNVELDAEFALGQQAKTSIPCHGTAFLAGTPVDGLGAAKPLIYAMNKLAQALKRKRLANVNSPEGAFYKKIYDSQGPKNIVFETGSHQILGKKIGSLPGILDPIVAEMNRQVRVGAIIESELVPSVLPLQLIQIGHLILVCCPGEFTTVAGQRVLQVVQKELAQKADFKFWLASYCNDYMGYVTTYEEYQQQAYEGGHTLYGQWTLGAFQMHFKQLAQQLLLEENFRSHHEPLYPPKVPQYELARRTNKGSLKTAVSDSGVHS